MVATSRWYAPMCQFSTQDMHCYVGQCNSLSVGKGHPFQQWTFYVILLVASPLGRLFTKVAVAFDSFGSISV